MRGRGREGAVLSAAQTIWVTGFLGAGKTRFVEESTSPLVPELRELDGLADPQPAIGPKDLLVAVVDGANLKSCLEDPLTADLVRHQIASADLVHISRTDLVDAGPVRALVADITDAPAFSLDGLNGATAKAVRGSVDQGIAHAFLGWQYEGPLILDEQHALALLDARQTGAYRLFGQVRLPDGGMDLQVIGRLKQHVPLRTAPERTCLTARGPSARFRPQDLDHVLAQAAADSAGRAGLFSYR